MLKPDWVNEIEFEHFLWLSYELLGNVVQLGCLLGGQQPKQTHGQLKLETWLPEGQISRKVSVEHCVENK